MPKAADFHFKTGFKTGLGLSEAPQRDAARPDPLGYYAAKTSESAP